MASCYLREIDLSTKLSASPVSVKSFSLRVRFMPVEMVSEVLGVLECVPQCFPIPTPNAATATERRPRTLFISYWLQPPVVRLSTL